MKQLKRLGRAGRAIVAVAVPATAEGGVWKSSIGVGAIPRIDLATLEGTSKPNRFAVRPPSLVPAKTVGVGSTFAIHSRSIYGYSDWRVNRKRTTGGFAELRSERAT